MSTKKTSKNHGTYKNHETLWKIMENNCWKYKNLKIMFIIIMEQIIWNIFPTIHINSPYSYPTVLICWSIFDPVPLDFAGDFRRAVKSLARQGRLEEAEDKNRKSASAASDVGAVWSAQFTWRCSRRCWFKNYICGLWMFMGGYCYRMIYWNHRKWWFTEVLWWFNWILW